jgi:hypothetical protein
MSIPLSGAVRIHARSWYGDVETFPPEKKYMNKCIVAAQRLGSKLTKRFGCVRVAKFLALSIGINFLAGCGTVVFDVSQGAKVKLLEVDAPVSITVERTIWYSLWGGIPLDDNHTASIIGYYNLKEVRMHTEYSVSDSIIDTFTSIVSYSRRRIIVEGNPRLKGETSK